VGVAVKVIEEPAQMLPLPEREILTEGVTLVIVPLIVSHAEYVELHAPVPALRTQ
jgi:hypothetical protein